MVWNYCNKQLNNIINQEFYFKMNWRKRDGFMMCNATNDEFVSKAELIRHLRFLFGSDSKVTQIYKEINNFQGINSKYKQDFLSKRK